VPYLSASAVVIHYEEALYQVYVPLPFTFISESGVCDFKGGERRRVSNSDDR